MNAIFWKLDNVGPIGLSIMVFMSKCFLQNLEEISIVIKMVLHITRTLFKRLWGDNHATLLDTINSQDLATQCTINLKNENKRLDIILTTIQKNQQQQQVLQYQNLQQIQN